MPRLILVLALVFGGGCARPPSTGVTSIKARSQNDLQGYLLGHKPDLDQFRLRGPFAVTIQNDQLIRISATEAVVADRYLATPAGKAPLVIFLHGNDNSKEDHAYQALHVASWGMDCLAVKLPNTGPWVANGRTLARLVEAIRRDPEIVDYRVDASKIILVGHSFGGAAVAIALGEGAPAVGAVLLDAAGIGKDLPRFLRQINKPVMLLGADEDVAETRNRDYFYRFIPAGVAEISIKDATHEDAQFPSEVSLLPFGATEELQITFVSALTATAVSLAATGRLDYAWSSFSEALGDGKFLNARRK